ncbi:MAG: DUF541 domain-containing protein [Planctomycetes bacterium]|nr:DUF541 domain-containing protein [Planctomycetota bacterium]
MKKLMVLTIVTLLSSACAAAKDPPEFTVTGEGKVFYTVDKADIQFSVSVRDEDVQECKTKHDAIVGKLNEYLKSKKYPKEILSFKSIILKREPGRSSKIEDDYYLSQSIYSIRTDRIGELSSLQADIVEIGVDEIQFVNLFSSKQRELEDQALERAIEDAKRRAVLIAKQLGWTLNKPTKISYTKSWYEPSRERRFGSRGARAASSPIITSANFVDITVHVTFSYKTEDETAQPTDTPEKK